MRGAIWTPDSFISERGTELSVMGEIIPLEGLPLPDAMAPRRVADTISPVFPGANWHERETHDFFGIVFRGHPNLEPLLLPEDATYHPLRKDFTG